MKADLEGVESAVVHLLGVDDVHGFRIASAVSGFFSEWKTSRRTLLGNVGTLTAMRGEIARLEPCWEAVEADGYYEAARKLNDSAVSAAGILAEVEKALDGVRVGTGDVRAEIWKVLSQSQ